MTFTRQRPSHEILETGKLRKATSFANKMDNDQSGVVLYSKNYRTGYAKMTFPQYSSIPSCQTSMSLMEWNKAFVATGKLFFLRTNLKIQDHRRLPKN